MTEVLQRIGNDPGLLTFWCPGCGCGHWIRVGAPTPGEPGAYPNAPVWQWDGDMVRPTVSPSILVQYDGADAGTGGAPSRRCHLFVRGGSIEYCSDSTHALAGQTVPMEVGP
jgi:hypothetical protein